MKNTVALALALAASLAAAQGPSGKKDGKSLEGRYVITSVEKNGEKAPDRKVKDVTVLITKDAIISTDKEKKHLYGANYTLDTGKTPWRIMMVGTTPKKGDKAAGIVALEGDTLKLCYALPGGAVPTKFVAGENQRCIVMRRVKD